MEPLRAIFYDLDGTLLHDDAVSPAPAARFAEARGLPYTHEEAFTRWKQLIDKYFSLFENGAISHDEQRRGRLREFDHSLKDADDSTLDAVFATFLPFYEESWGAYDDALPALRQAHQAGFAVAIVTNGDADMQRKKIAALKVTDVPFHVTVSGEVGKHKPDADVFLHACKAVKVEPHQALMVGDNSRNDVDGALNAGLHAVWLNRLSNARHRTAPTISTLSDLIPLALATTGTPV